MKCEKVIYKEKFIAEDPLKRLLSYCLYYHKNRNFKFISWEKWSDSLPEQFIELDKKESK